MKKTTILLLTIITLTILLTGCSNNVNTEQITDDPNKLTIHYFYEEGCPSCDVQDEFFEEIKQKHQEIEIKKHNTQEENNKELLKKLLNAYDERPNPVPITFISNEVIIGFGTKDSTGKLIEEIILECKQTKCKNPSDILKDEQEQQKWT